MKIAKLILIIASIIAIYVILICCIRIFPIVHTITKWILFSYIMLILAFYLFGGIALHFVKDENNILGEILWYMTWGTLAIAPFGLAVVIK